MNDLLRRVNAARRRLALSRLLQFLVWTMAAAASVSAALLFLRPALAPWPLAVGAAAALAAAIATRPSLRSAALALDAANDLKERLSTALVVTGDDPVSRAVIDDAVEHAKAADPGRIPIVRPRGLAWLGAPLAVLAVGFFWPRGAAGAGPDAPGRDDAAMVPPAVRKEESKKLMHRAFDLEKKAEKLESPKMKELAQEMKQISEEMKKKELDQQQALAKLSSLEQKAKERREELSKEGPFDSKTLQKSMGTGDGGASNPEREALKKKLGELAEKVEQAKELAKAGDAASKEKLDRLMKEMGKDLKDSLGKDQKDEELQKALDELADGLDGESPEALEKLLENVDGELEDLAKLLEEFDALEDELAALKAMKGQFDGELERCMFCGKMSGD